MTDRWRLVLVSAVIAAGVVLSVAQGVPDEVPAASLQFEYSADGIDRRDSAVVKTQDERLRLVEEMLEIAPPGD